MDPSIPLNAGGVTTPVSTNGINTGKLENGVAPNTPVEVQAAGKPESNEASSPPPKNTLIRRFRRAYGAALVVTGIGLPIVASAITVIIYFSPPLAFLSIQPPTPSWYAPLWGLIISYILWFITALPGSYFASAKGANTGSYNQITSRLCQLKARLDNEPELKPGDTYSLIALKEAQALYASVDSSLKNSSNGLHWVLGTGYINTWSMIHRIEETLIEVEPIEMVVRGALHDKLSIQGSTMSNREKLLEKLTQAVKDLDPLAMVYFTEPQPGKHREDLLMQQNKILAQLVQVIGKNDTSIPQNVSPQPDIQTEEVANSDHTPGPDAQANARVVLREVRRTLNDFRDNLWEKLVKARNQLLGAIFLTGFATHILLCIALLTSTSKSSQPIMAATVFYMVGAVFGLFGRLYGESRTKAIADDYGLSLARLVAIPLLSGLAGVSGVLVYGTLLVDHSGTSQPLMLQNIFSLNNLSYLIAAAVFGLTPNLIIRSLQKQADKYLSGLRHSKGAEEETIGGKD